MIHVTPNPAAHPRTQARVAVVAVACVLAAAIGTTVIARSAAQRGGAAAGPEAVARAYFDALASFNAEGFEAMARERFAPATLARRTPAERARMLERIRGDFGTLTLVAIRSTNDEQCTLTVTGSTGTAGRIEIGLEGAPPYRITSVSVEVGEQEAAPPGPPPPPISGSMTQADLVRALDAYLAARAKADEFAGVVAVAKAGKVVFQKPYGLANREAKAPVMASTRFNIASIGKAFTKTAVGQLMAQGKLALTDTIGMLLPDYPNPKARTATIDQLLTHQAGIADFFGPAFTAAPKTDFASNADYYRFVSAQPLTFDPGAGRQYCNGCYVVLGEIVARVSGQRYEDYIVQHIFTPAGMTGAGFFRADRLPPAVAQQYSTQMPGANGTLKNAREAHGVAGSGAGGSYAAAADLLAFDDAIRTGKLLDAKMTGWFLDADAPAAGARARGGIGIAGGAPGTNALLETDEHWAVAVVGNLDPPASAGVGLAIKRALSGCWLARAPVVMPPPVVAQVSSAPSAYPVATSIAGTLSMVKGYITKSAEQAPESLYAYKATPDVRSLGQLFGHVANANFGICSAIAGEKSPATADFEKSATTKVDLTKALADSYAYCEKERWRTPPGRGGPGTRRQGHHELNGGYATLPRGRRRNLW